MEIAVIINGQRFEAKLSDSDATSELTVQFPLEKTFQKSGDHEFFCRLNRGINVREMEGTSDIHKNGIYYFEDWKALSFVYKDMSISPYKVVPLGKFTDDICAALESAKNKAEVRLETV